MSRWFRFYDDAINDPKVLRLSAENYRNWTFLLCVASKLGGKLPCTADIGFYLRIKPAKAATLISELVEAGLLDKIDDGYEPHNWSGRQYQSDTSKERVQRHRDKRAAAGLVPQWTAPTALRKAVYDADRFECVYCAATEFLSIDHKTSELNGGTHDFENLVTACRSCNGAKRDLSFDEYVTKAKIVTLHGRFSNSPREQITENRTEQSRTDTLPTVAERARQRKRRDIPIPVDWKPSVKSYQIAEQFGQNVQIVEGIFRDYLASSGKLYADYDAAFHNFIRNQNSFNRGASNGIRQPENRGSIVNAADRAIANLEREIAADNQGCEGVILSLPAQRLR
jgi:5-methylcytosine-specific restriction endonuclease McrA